MDFIEDGGSGAIQDSSAYDSLIGRTIANKFRLLKRIGAGAMGRVYQAEQLSLGKMVAIKILRHELMADEKLVRRFELEARTASAVSHPNLIETFDCGRDLKLDLAYIAMELLHGPDLAQVIAREAPLDLQRSARIIDQVLAALEEAHAEGIVHRDLKPGNIMLVPRRDDPEFVKVCDFGIAKIKTARARPSLTMAGLVFGTPEYMSPEQACGEDVDARADLYAVAAILYQLVSGQLPFPAPSPTEVLARILRDEPERPSERGYVTVPPAIENLILRGMSKDREARPQTAADFRVALRDAWSGVMDYWPGQSTALPTLSLHPVTSSPLTPSTPIPRGPSGERPVFAPPARGPSAERAVVAPTPPAAMAAAARPPSRIINWSVLARRRPRKSAVLGFTLTLACGGLGMWALTSRHAPLSTQEASAPRIVPAHPHMSTSPPSATEGIIVVPSPPPTSVASGDRHAAATRPSPVHHESPARLQKPGAGEAGIAHKLRITSIPSDAEVLLDGNALGRTPLFGADVEMSHPHRVVLRKEGYALFEQTITPESEWVIKPSDRSAALLRISALLRRSDAALAQNPAGASP